MDWLEIDGWFTNADSEAYRVIVESLPSRLLLIAIMITCITHTAAANGKCVDCGMELPLITFQSNQYRAAIGERVGVITSSLNTGVIAYRIGEHDSNMTCLQWRHAESGSIPDL